MIKTTFFTVLLLLALKATCQDLGQSIKTKEYNPQTNLVIWPEEFNPEIAKWYVYNEIEINAEPEIVWNILIDAKNWHTFYKGVESAASYQDCTATSLADGMTFNMHTMGLHLKPVIKEFVPHERLAWEVRRKDLTAYHAWVIVPTANGCRLITPEAQNGFLTFLQRVFQPNKLLDLHEHWLEVIKMRAEGTSVQISQSERNEMKAILHSSLAKFDAAVEQLSPAQLNFRTAKDEWSIAECIEHIALTELEFPRILEAETRKPADPSMRREIKISDEDIQPKMTSRKWKAKSPEIFKPSGRFPDTKHAIKAFREQRNQTIAYIANTKEDLRNRYWKHPLTGRIDLYQTLLLMSAHVERHLDQIENIKSSKGYPTV